MPTRSKNPIHKIGNLTFKGRYALYLYVMDKYNNSFDPNDQLWIDLTELSRSFYKFDKKIVRVEKNNARNYGPRLFYHIDDGSVIKVHLNTTINSKVFSYSEKSVNKAFKNSIKESNQLFLLANGYQCSECGKTCEHVAYTGPFFCELKYAFLHHKKYIPFSLKWKSEILSYVFLQDDEDYEQDWIKFHNENTKMIPVCISCYQKWKHLEHKAKVAINVALHRNNYELTLTLDKLKEKYENKFSKSER